jgi:SAM-dependent methyltransferase
MKVTSTSDVIDVIEGFLPAVALGAAMQRGLFWRLGDGPESVDALASALEIPRQRCAHLVRVLADLGLVEEHGGAVALTSTARTEILGVFSAEGWALYAEDILDHYPLGLDLASRLGHDGSLWALVEGVGSETVEPESVLERHRGSVGYVRKLAVDQQRAATFGRLLYEIHRPFGEYLAETLDLRGDERVMDLGGGSGVVSLALLRRHPRLTAVVVEIPAVCAAGREITRDDSAGTRLSFHPADFTVDDLPAGFDLVIECDVSVYSRSLFAKVAAALVPGGRFVIADRQIDAGQVLGPSDALYGFRESLNDPAFAFPTVEDLSRQLADAGLELESVTATPRGTPILIARHTSIVFSCGS